MEKSHVPGVHVLAIPANGLVILASAFELGPRDVHIFRFDLDAGDPGDFVTNLVPDERRHANRFVYPVDRDRFVVARGLLRRVLGNYLARAEREVVIDRNASGKPVTTDGIEFNVSHSAEACLIAVTRAGPVGVDIERIRADIDLAEVARTWFAPTERDALLHLPECQRTRALFACWSRKEAYLKARGDGLERALSSFEVSTALRGDVKLVRDEHDPEASSCWTLCDIPCSQDFVAALAVGARKVSLAHFDGIDPASDRLIPSRIPGNRAFS